MAEIQYVSDQGGNPVGVIVPIELCRDIESEKETAYLPREISLTISRGENMKRRLLEAKERQEGISFDEACEKLGI